MHLLRKKSVIRDCRPKPVTVCILLFTEWILIIIFCRNGNEMVVVSVMIVFIGLDGMEWDHDLLVLILLVDNV